MKFTPHDYQIYCTDYLKTHPVAALFLEMGLGKSVIALTAINDLMLDRFQVSKVLIIAPLRVARDTWPAEIAKWDVYFIRWYVNHSRLPPYLWFHAASAPP